MYVTRVTKCKLISESRCHYDNKKHNLFKYYIHIYNVIRIEINVKHTQKRRKMKNAKNEKKTGDKTNYSKRLLLFN